MHFSFATSSQILSSLSFLLVNIYFARELNLERYGEYALVLGGALFISTINGACVQQAILSQQYQDQAAFFNTARLLNLLTIVALSIFTAVILRLIEKGGTLDILMIFIPYSLKEFIKKEMAASGQFLSLSILEVISSALLFGFCLVFSYSGSGMSPERVLSYSYILILVLYVGKLLPNFANIDLHEISNILHFVKWVMPATLLGMFGLPALPLALGAFVGIEQVGIFRAVQNVFGISNLLNQVYDSWLQPALRRSHDVKLINRVQKLNFIGFVVFGLILLLAWETIFATLYGTEFLLSSHINTNIVLVIYATFVTSVFLSVERIRTKIFGSPVALLKAGFITMIVCVAGYFLLKIIGSFSLIFWFLTLAMTLSTIYLFFSVRHFQNEKRYPI